MANYRIGTTLSSTCASLASNLDKNRNSRPGTPVSRFSNQTCNPNAKERKRKILSNHPRYFLTARSKKSVYIRVPIKRVQTLAVSIVAFDYQYLSTHMLILYMYVSTREAQHPVKTYLNGPGNGIRSASPRILRSAGARTARRARRNEQFVAQS